MEYDDVQFDTIEMPVAVTDGAVLLSDINAAYEQMRNVIQQFKVGFSHNNQNLYFINVFINAEGSARIALMTTFTSTSKDLEDHHWYFPDTFGYIDSVCLYYFDSYSYQYAWDGYGKTELERILNLFEHHNIGSSPVYFTPTRNYSFEYPNWTDSYGSPFVYDSRVFAKESASNTLVYELADDEMCYCLDSYLGLGYDYIENNYFCNDERPVNWIVKDTTVLFQNNRWHSHFHKLKVQYGRSNSTPNPDPNY